ncbi:MAG: LacI family DNA-binding transcriptional regulator [Anaerolineae bacterium]|nr:LacI family DNA-binding transcriptional regulator [Anaerolineae bacterium]MCA9887066.1 LacI family DNA-binding transcriptional regulator [Anaerolineae bacterium]MCA9891858.1 LacI family DNA-binding transcriptional regulator [Anaerolineae bacterium]MCB9460639.1 LacI family DNA-binding transcriptional regulator [Anaerolineaceae bacterium]
MKKLTISAIAELAGVSKATVSRVLNGYPHISQELREQVEAIIAETGYQPNQVARSLASDRSNIIGLVIPKGTDAVFLDPYFPALTNGITQVSNNNSLTLALFIFHSEQEGHDTIKSIVNTGLLDGLILTTDRVTLDRTTDPFVPQLIERDMPFVMIGRPDNLQDDIIFIDTDNAEGGYLATRHLIDLGYQRIATISSKHNSAGDDRLAGYRKALDESDIAIDWALVAYGDYTLESGYKGMKKLLPQQPDAVFVASDTMALGALRAIQEVGLKVPHDIAIVGYDDLPPAIQATPQLTTVRQDVETLGGMAVEMLLDAIRGDKSGIRHVFLSSKLIIRDSCGAVQKQA